MSAFRRALDARRVDPRHRRWVFVPYDQLTSAMGPLSRERVEELGIVLIENPAKAARRPYHRQKLALVLANGRQFALEQAQRGVAIRHEVAQASYAESLTTLARELGPMRVMDPAERELRVELAPLVRKGVLEIVAHEGWLTEQTDFEASQSRPPWRMDTFYRHVRKTSGVLMHAGKPLGGRVSFDVENRRPWRGAPEAPTPPRFRPDDVTSEVCDLVATHFAHHPGTLRPHALPATAADAERLWTWAKTACIPHFGPFEDAMATTSRGLFHTRLSPLLNILRLPVARVLADVVALDVALASKEGFVRQILGWREFVRHVHRATDGFRKLPGERGRIDAPIARFPGDGGWAGWTGRSWESTVSAQHAGPRKTPRHRGDGGSLATALGAERPLPPAYWGVRSGLRCLDEIVAGVWEEGWSHHITRLMVLSNLATLLDVSPRILTDWFWVAYIDAFDWVVEPNVHGMGTFGVGPLFTTKPYVAGAAYIDRMSDYCKGCRFDPKTNCPITSLYWAFLGRHARELGHVGRMRLPLLAEKRRSPTQKREDRAVFERVRRALDAGEELAPSER